MLHLLLAAALLSADAPASAGPKPAPPQSGTVGTAGASAAETWLSPVGLKVGDRGKIKAWTIAVEEVVDQNTIIASVTRTGSLDPKQPNSVIIKPVDPPCPRVWIVGLESASLPRNGKLTLATGIVVVEKMKTTKNADGTSIDLPQIRYTRTPAKPQFDGPNKVH